jgi:TonB family protein
MWCYAEYQFTPMKNLTSLIALCTLVVATQATAAIESISVKTTTLPQMPFSLLERGVIEGRVVVAVDINAEGKLTDHLVIGYTHAPLVKPIVEALTEWQYQPARRDGVPVPAQVELTVTMSATGVVVSQTGMEMVETFMERVLGDHLKYRTSRPDEIDRVPVRTNTVAPKYAEAALKQGVRGKVQVHFYIDENGAARMPAVDNSDHPYLAEIAVAAVREWKFEPPTAKGNPVLVAVSQEFLFGDGR